MNEILRRILFASLGAALFEAPVLSALRNRVLSLALGAGPGCSFGHGCMVGSPHRLHPPRPAIGSNVVFMAGCFVDISGGIVVEDDVWFSRGSKVLTHSHGFESRRRKAEQGTVFSPLRLGRDAWIGTAALVLPSVTEVGEGAIVGAGSVVTRDVEAWTVVAGNPARVVRRRGQGERDRQEP